MYNLSSLDPTQQLSAINAALAKSMAIHGDDLQKTFTQSSNQLTGLTAFSLEAPAKTFYPVLTPLRNSLPRATGGMGIQANWRAVVAINANRAAIGVSEGNRGQNQAVTVREYNAAFRTIGIDSFVTEEARLAGEGFDDVEARAVQSNLNALMIAEEVMILGGQGTFGLGTPAGLTLTAQTTGGTLPTGTTYHMRCVALTLESYINSIAGDFRGQVTRTTADGVSESFGGGSSQASASQSVATASATATITGTITPVPGAVGYAWFVGPDATNVRLAGVTTVNSFVLRAPLLGTETLIPVDLLTNDRSQNALAFDGFFAQVARSGSNALWRAMPTGTAGAGTPLTSDNAGGCVEIDSVLEWYWNNHRISPTTIWVSGREMQRLRQLALTGASTSMQRFTFNVDQRNIVMSGKVRGYTNPFAMSGSQEVPIMMHPNMPPGTIFFQTQALPYSLPGVTDVNRILCRRDYYQIVYPQVKRRKEFGIYSDQLLQVYFPPANAVLTNIGA